LLATIQIEYLNWNPILHNRLLMYWLVSCFAACVLANVYHWNVQHLCSQCHVRAAGSIAPSIHLLISALCI